jgi:hypothetical protein
MTSRKSIQKRIGFNRVLALLRSVSTAGRTLVIAGVDRVRIPTLAPTSWGA